MHWKDFLYFQRGSRVAVILLLILILLTLILNSILGYRNSTEVVLAQNDSLVREFEMFQKHLKLQESFDHKRDTLTVKANRWERKTTGITKKDYPVLRSESGEAVLENENEKRPSSHRVYPSVRKLSVGETISLNTTDTAEWKKIPGIGSAYASRIVKYRDLLGGFVQVEQLREVYGIDDALYSRIEPYVKPDGNYRTLQINNSEFRELLRHPYLNYKQVKAIVGLRRKKGDISSIRELSILDEFTNDDILRLEPYLEF